MWPLIETYDFRVLADFFAFEFLQKYKGLFIVYPIRYLVNAVFGTAKSDQRWEQCVQYLLETHHLAVEALYAEKYFDAKIQDSAKDFIKEAIIDLKLSIKGEDTEALNSIEYIVGYPEEIFDSSKIQEYYEELDLNGTEGLVETYLKLENFNQRILNDPAPSWRRKLNSVYNFKDMTYFPDENIVCKFVYYSI